MISATGVAATPHDPAATAIKFFNVLHGDGPTQLTFIAPNRTDPIVTRTLVDPTELLRKYDGVRNAYYTLNRLRPGTNPNKKPEKADVGEVIAFHVDIDPRVGETQAEAKERLVAKWTSEAPQSDVPKPTFVVYSGGGVQLIWKLRSPIPISDIAAAEDVERYNRYLAAQCEGDDCYNIDRILRVPGLLNLPDAGKVKKGRVPARAELVAYNPEALYEPSDFKQMPKQPAPVGRGAGQVQIDSSNINRLDDIRELEKYGVPDRVMVLCVQGKDPENPNKYESRSEALYDAVCQLVRANVSEEIIYSIITDPAFAISESVLDKGRGADKYAKRQIDNAKVTTQDFVRNKNDVPRGDVPANIARAIAELGVKLSYDEFANRMLVEGLPDFGPILQDEAVNRLRILCAEKFQLSTKKDFFYDVVQDIAWRDKFHPVRDYLDRLEWDGTPRLDSWLCTLAGADDNAYTRAVGAIILMAAVRRVRQPGVKFDEMVVFESETGLNKSSALALLAVQQDWFTDGLPLGRPTKEVIEIIGGKWIIECAELDGLKEDKVENIKAFLSRQVDRARAAYGRLVQNVPRQCVFFGSTNHSQYLFDTTGNRRFWPVRITKFDLQALKRDRDQLWAEAAVREANGESIRLAEELWAIAAEEQAARLAVDPWQERLDGLLGDRQGLIKGSDIWRLLDIPTGNQTQQLGGRVGRIMQALGFVRRQRRFNGGKPVGVYIRGDDNIMLEVRHSDQMGWIVHVDRPKAVAGEQLDAPF